MSGIIHMDTEQTRQTAVQLIQAADQLERQAGAVLNMVRGIPWESDGRDQYVAELSLLVKTLLTSAEQVRTLGLQVQREVDEWLTIDDAGEQKFISIITKIGIIGTISGMLIQDAWWEFQYADFKEWWSSLDQSQKKQYLQWQYSKIVKRLGAPAIPVSFENLPDDGGDTRGKNTGDRIIIDTDNLSSDEPWRLIETLAHEARHTYQNQVVQQFNATGKFPDGLTEAKVKSWVNDQGTNYIKPEDDPEGYWTQPVETDSRDYGGSYMQEVFNNQDWGADKYPTPAPDTAVYASANPNNITA
jgi:hypothetical protein